MCEALAVYFGLACSHCVDDMIGTDPSDWVVSGWKAWRYLARRCGWEISDEKSPPPSQRFMVIGVTLDTSGTPAEPAHLSVSTKRIKALSLLLESILQKSRLPPGEASSLAGKLGFALNTVFGRVGRAKLRPIFDRCHTTRFGSGLSPQLRSCLLWWLQFLHVYVSREIPTSMSSRPLVVSYSDGEGDKAGVGVSIYSSLAPRPLAAFALIPDVIRRLWSRRAGKGVYHDIFLVEAIGPLLLLCTYPEILRGSAWAHYIDNTAAQHALLRGSSSISSGDHVVGATWVAATKLDCWPYFDRVHTKSNPIDGVSRGDFSGPWERVVEAVVPLQLIREMELSCS